jgi:hypothetical protein
VVRRGPWSEPDFADSTLGDNVDGEDLVVRRAAVEALGPLNGTVVVTDPNTGRILNCQPEAGLPQRVPALLDDQDRGRSGSSQ